MLLDHRSWARGIVPCVMLFGHQLMSPVFLLGLVVSDLALGILRGLSLDLVVNSELFR